MHITTIHDKYAVLKQHFLFSQLDPADLDRITKLVVERYFSDDQIIFQQGQEGSSMLALLHGRVRISTLSEDGKELILNMIEPGQVFGEIALIDGKRRSANATAVGECTLLVIHRSDFIPLLRHNPDISIRLLSVLCERLRKTSEIAESVALFTTPVRLARLLLRIAGNHGVETAHGLRIDVKLSQTDLGNFIAARRETVNRQLQLWQERGWISLEQGYIIILQPGKLKELTQ